MGDTSSSSAISLSPAPEAVRLPFGVPTMEAIISFWWPQRQDFESRSGPPKKIVLIGDDGEEDQTFPIGQEIKEAFETRITVAEVAEPNPKREERKVRFDFVSRVVFYIDKGDVTEKTRGFYWVDEDGWIFLPHIWGGASEDSVRKAFDGASDGRFAVTAVRRCRHRESRTVGFLDKMKVHGARVFGWYGGAADDVQDAADGGDLTVNWQLLGAAHAYGRGIHLSAQGKPMTSVNISVPSMNDPKSAHLLYCALAPGFLEIIPAGSPQSQPGNSLFGSGTDDLKQPTWHVFWESLMGTQVLPLYLISFRRTGILKRPTGSQAPHKKASSQKKVRFNV